MSVLEESIKKKTLYPISRFIKNRPLCCRTISTLTGNIGSGQNVSWPIVTRGNIGDDAALSRRIDVNITSLYNPMICGKIFRLGEASVSSLALGTRRGNIGADAAL